MTPLETLNRLAELQKDATKGPWLYRPNKYDDWGVVKEGNNSIGPDQGYFVAKAGYGGHITQEIEHDHRLNKTDPYGPNALFIAQSGSTDFAALAAYVERLEGALRSIELSVDAVNGGGKPEKALSQIKGKCRKALGEKP
jgi:hypothetical protein